MFRLLPFISMAKALNRGLWFKVLSGVERSMVDLVIKVVRDCVKSSKLARLMKGVVTKLMQAMESQFVRVAREVGRPVAYRLSRIALAWGNTSAVLWVRDALFVRYLTVMYMNSPEAFG